MSGYVCEALNLHSIVGSSTASFRGELSYSHFTKEELKEAQRGEVTFLDRSQCRHILKSGLSNSKALTSPAQPVTHSPFILCFILFGERTVSALKNCTVSLGGSPASLQPLEALLLVVAAPHVDLPLCIYRDALVETADNDSINF